MDIALIVIIIGVVLAFICAAPVVKNSLKQRNYNANVPLQGKALNSILIYIALLLTSAWRRLMMRRS